MQGVEVPVIAPRLLGLYRAVFTIRINISMTSISVSKEVSWNRLVLNWHLTETCNYGCGFCYAHWNGKIRSKELIHDREQSRQLLDELYAEFDARSPGSPLAAHLAYSGLRLNLAGGEPFLYPQKCLELIDAAKRIGFEVSVITNGSRLSAADMGKLAPNLLVLGISIDSITHKTNRAIGRASNQGRTLSLGDILEKVAAARATNPSIMMKINTVVNSHNWNENLSSAIEQLRPGRWKVLRALPVVTDRLSVSQKQFNEFVARHSALRNVMCIEDNVDMTESYIMIDPHGRFFQNRTGDVGYDYSEPILKVGAKVAFDQIHFDTEKFLSRYQKEKIREFT